MATVAVKPKLIGTLHKRQRGQTSSTKDSRGLKWQRRRIRLMPTELEYYGVKTPIQSPQPNGTFPLERIKIVSEIPISTFGKKFCFQVTVQV